MAGASRPFSFCGSGACRRVAAQADAPRRDRERERCCSNERNERGVDAKFRAAEKARRGIKRGEAEGNDPAQQKLDVAGIDGERIAAEGQKIPEGRMDADAVLEPERKSRKKEEDGDVDEAATECEESEEKNIERMPWIVKTARRPDNHDQTDDDFLQGLNAEGVEDHLEQGRERAEKNAVEFAFHDIGGAEFVEVERKNIEQSERDEREAVKKDDFFHAPVG